MACNCKNLKIKDGFIYFYPSATLVNSPAYLSGLTESQYVSIAKRHPECFEINHTCGL